MSNLSANAQLLGNLEHTTAELLEGMTEERGRGFASDNESWAALKGYLERAEKMRKDIEKVHKEMWDAIKDQNDDAYRALANEPHNCAETMRTLRRCAMAAGDMDGKRYRTAKRYLVWCRPARWCGYQAMLPIAYQMRYRKDGTIAHTAIVQETKAHCQHEIPLEKVFEEEPHDEADKTTTCE